MAHSPGYPTDNNRQPDGNLEGSREVHNVAVETKTRRA